jgi:hypothetical protein
MFHSAEFYFMIITFGVMIASFAYIAWEYRKLEKFRESVRPGTVIQMKYFDDVIYKVVLKRTCSDRVILCDLDDQSKQFSASILRIYPL